MLVQLIESKRRMDMTDLAGLIWLGGILFTLGRSTTVIRETNRIAIEEGKPEMHIGFWGILWMGVASILFWPFVIGMLYETEKWHMRSAR